MERRRGKNHTNKEGKGLIKINVLKTKTFKKTLKAVREKQYIHRGK